MRAICSTYLFHLDLITLSRSHKLIKTSDCLIARIEDRAPKDILTISVPVINRPLVIPYRTPNRCRTLRVTTWLTWPPAQQFTTDSPPHHPQEIFYYQVEDKKKTDNRKTSPRKMTTGMTHVTEQASLALSLLQTATGPRLMKVKVKFSLEQAMKAQRGSRCIVLLFLQPRR